MNKLFIIILMVLFSCNFEKAKVENGEYEIIDRSKDYNEICIKGHIYYVCGNQLAIRLNDYGKPIKCKVKK